MSFSVKKETLMAGLDKISGAVDKGKNLPILKTVNFNVCGGMLSITGTDLERFATSVAPVVSLDPVAVAFCVDFEKIKGAISSCPDETVEVLHSGLEISISSGTYLCSLRILPSDDFPVLETSSGKSFTLVEQGLFRLVQSSIGHAASKDEERFALCGVYFEGDGERLTCVACDGHRLSLAELDCQAAEAFAGGVIIPSRTMALLSKTDGLTRVFSQTENLLRVEGLQSAIASRLIDNRYPDYQRFLATHKNGIFVNSEEIVRAISACGVVNDDKFCKSVILEVSDSCLVVSALGAAGRATYSILCNGDSGLKISINGRYLSQALSALGGEVCLRYTDETTPITIIPVDHGVWNARLEVVMPLRSA